jgi:hypothetical protein
VSRIWLMDQEYLIRPCVEPADEDGEYPVYSALQEGGVPTGVSFATSMLDALAAEYTDQDFLWIPTAKGGTPSVDWLPTSTRLGFYGGACARINHALRYANTRLVGVIEMQGETDATAADETAWTAAAWLSNWTTINAALRTKYGAGLPVAVVKHWPTFDEGVRPSWPDLLDDEDTLGALTGNILVEAPDGPFESGNVVHLETAAQEALGADLAAAIIADGWIT